MVVQALLDDWKRDEDFREEEYLRAIKKRLFDENDGFFFFFEILEFQLNPTKYKFLTLLI